MWDDGIAFSDVNDVVCCCNAAAVLESEVLCGIVKSACRVKGSWWSASEEERMREGNEISKRAPPQQLRHCPAKLAIFVDWLPGSV